MGWTTVATCATCAFLARTIWVRRWTLTAPSDRAALAERTITTGVFLQLCALFLFSPMGAATFGRALHAVFGHWNLEMWAGHCVYIGAAGLIGMTAASRLDIPTDRLLSSFRRSFEYPMTAIVSILLGLLVMSPNGDKNWADLLDSPTDHWLDAYWTLLCGFLILLFGRAIRYLLILRREQRNRITATIYIAACGGSIIDCGWRILTTWTDIDDISWVNWAAGYAGAIAFGYAASRSWRQKIEWMKGARL